MHDTTKPEQVQALCYIGTSTVHSEFYETAQRHLAGMTERVSNTDATR